MSKVTIELELKEIRHIAAIHSLVRLFEIAEFDDKDVAASGRPQLDEHGFLPDEEFWSISIPKAIQAAMEASQFLITYGYEDKLIHAILHSDEWSSAISWLKQETASLDEQFAETKSLCGAKEGFA